MNHKNKPPQVTPRTTEPSNHKLPFGRMYQSAPCRTKKIKVRIIIIGILKSLYEIYAARQHTLRNAKPRLLSGGA